MVTTNEITISFCRFLSFVWLFSPRLRLVHCLSHTQGHCYILREDSLTQQRQTTSIIRPQGTSYSGGRDYNHEEGKKIKGGKRCWGES